MLAVFPLVVAWFMGNREGRFGAPIAVAGSILMAVYLGGVALIWTVLFPTAVALVILGRCVKGPVEIGLCVVSLR